MAKYCFSLILLFLSIFLFSQEKEIEDLKLLKEKIQFLKSELEKSQNVKKSYENDLKKISLQLEIISKELQKIKIEKKILEGKVAKSATEVLTLKSKLEEMKKRLVFKLQMLQKMGKLGYLRLFFSTKGEDFLSVLRWILHFSYEDRKLFINYYGTFSKLKKEREELKKSEENLRLMEESIKGKYKEYEEIEKQKKILIAQLDRKNKETEAQITLYKEKVERLENLLKIINSKEPEVLAKEDINKFKGVLEWPKKGKIKTSYGKITNPQYSTTILSNGIEVELKNSEDIYPIFPGKVIYAKWFKGYNNLVVIDHGNNVVSITGYLHTNYVKEGEWVHTNKAIGRITTEPYIYYFEIREKGIPVDPLKWLR